MPDEMVASGKRFSAPTSPTLRDVLMIVFRHPVLFVGAFLVVFTGSVSYGWLRPCYQAHMKILLRRGRVDPMVTSEQRTSVEFSRSDISEEELNSEAELLRDQDLLQAVVKENALDSPARLSWLPWRKDTREIRMARAIRSLAQRLKAEPVRRTNIITVSYETSNRVEAAQVLRSLARAYVDKHKRAHRSADELPFFEEQSKRSRRELDEAESRLLDFSRDQSVVSAAMERDLVLRRVAEIEASYQQAQVAIVETIHRIRALEDQMKSLPERSTSQIRTADNPQLLETLKAKLLELELKRTELLTRYDPGYRLVQEVEDQILQTKAVIGKEELAPVREETTEKDPNYEWAKAELGKAQVELYAAEARARAINNELLSCRAQARRLGEDAVRQQNLLTGMKTAEETYLLYAKKSEQARIGDALDERSILNVTVVESPQVPALPKYSTLTYVIVGLFAATITSTGLTFAADHLDPAFRTPEEVEATLNLPVLASLPREAA
jgi:uncharacterized protein involved in exopolysaccharide biosynthesis